MKNTQYRTKSWEELTLADHFIFQKFMLNDELCKQVISEIIVKEVVKIERSQYEKSIQMRWDSKGIRLDVYVKGDDEVYNIEIQNSEESYIPKRSRFYQNMMDLDLLEKGDSYEELCHSYVIFICTFDYFGLEQYRYTFTYKCAEVEGLEFGDMTTHIILNTMGCKGDISDKLKTFLQCINDVFSDDSFSAKIKQEVNRIKFSEEWRVEYMYYELSLKEREKIGEARGIEIGEARAEKKFSTLISALSKANRIDDIQRVSEDETYRKQLYKEFHIGEED